MSFNMKNAIFRDMDSLYIFRAKNNITITVHRPYKEEVAYYIQRHTCPNMTCQCEILTCSCPSFQMGKPGRAVDPFTDPCKHIMELFSILDWREQANRAVGW